MLMQYINPKVIDSYREAHQALFQELVRDAVEQALQSSSPNKGKETDSSARYLSVKEAAELSTLAPSTVRSLIRQGKLPARKMGRRVMIKPDDLERLMVRTRTAGNVLN